MANNSRGVNGALINYRDLGLILSTDVSFMCEKLTAVGKEAF